MRTNRLAFACALLFARFRHIEDGLFPLASAIKTTPIIALKLRRTEAGASGHFMLPFGLAIIKGAQWSLDGIGLEFSTCVPTSP